MEMGKYIAVYSDSAFTGVGILSIEYENGETYCINEYVSSNGVRKSKNKVYTDFSNSNRNYIKKYGRKYYLDEFMRTDNK